MNPNDRQNERQENFYHENEIKRTYTPEEAGHDRRRKPVSRFRRRRRKPVNPGAVLLILIFVMIAGICIYMIAARQPNIAEGGDTSEDLALRPESTAPDPSAERFVTLSEEEIHTGDLILVNYAYPYAFPESAEAEIISVAKEKTDLYYVRDSASRLRSTTIARLNVLAEAYYDATGFSGLQVNSGYRSYQEQVDLYAEYTETRGEEYARAYVANPGYSEHHTGLAMDLNVYVPGEGVYYIESYEPCAWFREHCADYGFILRYPEEKVYITGINYESWHYRYVGTPHSLIMEEQDLCLEEYVDYLKTFTYDGNRLLFDPATGTSDTLAAGEAFERGTLIYYVPAADGETECRIPGGCTYTISGNNVDGFIVTAEKK